MNTKIVLAFVCVSVGVISAFPYPGKKILRAGLFNFKVLSKSSVNIFEYNTYFKTSLKAKALWSERDIKLQNLPEK